MPKHLEIRDCFVAPHPNPLPASRGEGGVYQDDVVAGFGAALAIGKASDFLREILANAKNANVEESVRLFAK